MLKQILLLTALSFTSCQNNNKQVENALAFVNAYVENCNKMNQAVRVTDWVNSSELATKQFKIELKKLVDEARENDPEMGLEADPVFDAQDYPEKGFELESVDPTGNYVIVKGKNWPEFKLIIKMAKENGNWLVDGCGMVNIPEQK